MRSFCFLLSCFLAIIFCLAQVPSSAFASDLTPAVSDLSKQFSEKFCRSIVNGMTFEKAGETSAAQLSKGVVFSPVLNEIMSAPREDLVDSLSENINNACGNDLNHPNEDLDAYLAQFVNKVPTGSSKRFQIAPMR